MYKVLRKKRTGNIIEEVKGETVGLVKTNIIQILPEGLELESGEVLPGPIDVAYETYGTLNEDKSNVILVCHALSGSAHAAGYHRMIDEETFDGATEGWWEDIIGPGKGIDTNKFFVICSNFLGSCYGTTGPTSVNPKTGKRYGITFPTITISDMVKVQRELIRQLGIEKLLAVVGGSMGGMQALEWSIMYPEVVESAVVIAATASCSAQNIAFDAVGRNAIISDPNWENGEYLEKGKVPSKGLSIARMIGHITYLSSKSMDLKFGRKLINGKTYDIDNIEFEVESYLGYQGEKFVNRFDANSYLYITKAMDYFDLTEKYGNGDLKEVFRKTNIKFLFISFSTDWLFPSSESLEMVSAALAAGKYVSYINIESINGHDSFLIDTEIESKAIKAFLDATFQEKQNRKEKTYERRKDFEIIERIIEEGSRVLDLGCGDGELLVYLREKKKVRSVGIEIDTNEVIECLSKGLNVIHYDINKGFKDKNFLEIEDKAFDYVIVSKTIQQLKSPGLLLEEILRISKNAIVSFPNFGYYKLRLQLLLKGTMPVSSELPYSWFDTPNIHLFTYRDFVNLCKAKGIKIKQTFFISRVFNKEMCSKILPNLLAEEVITVLSYEDSSNK